MQISKFIKKTTAIFLTATMVLGATTMSAFATEKSLNPIYKYDTNAGFTFEKISHAQDSVESPDGIVDYIPTPESPYPFGTIKEYVDGESATGNGARGQSYSYASATYGDWVYINTMYGGLGIPSIFQYKLPGFDNVEQGKALLDLMFNGNAWKGEEDGKQAGGVLLKFNVKTGETKILMSLGKNRLAPTFRAACEKDGKLYFVGMVVDLNLMDIKQAYTAMMSQVGYPCIYEVDPANDDKLTKVYDCGSTQEAFDYYEGNNPSGKEIFPSTRAITTYKDTMIIGGLSTREEQGEGVYLAASKNPSEGQDSFHIIADVNDFLDYPAYYRDGVNGGGGIYQAIEFNDKLYVVVCTGKAETLNEETGTLRTFAIFRGDCNGDPTERSSWTWSLLAGDEADGAKYPFGLDESRVSAGACTLEVYDDHLWIGEYNDTSSALQSFIYTTSLKVQATNLEQSVNMYRMDKDENIEMIVGDPTERFPEGGISGYGSGYESHLNQYTWQTMVYNGKLYVSTQDSSTLLRPIVQLRPENLLKMTPEEWKSQINYIKVFAELMSNKEEETPALQTFALNDEQTLTEADAEAMVEDAIKAATIRTEESTPAVMSNDENSADYTVTLTDEQKDKLVDGLLDGSIAEGMLSEEEMSELTQINTEMTGMTSLIDQEGCLEDFEEAYSIVVDHCIIIDCTIPENLKKLYDALVKVATLDNLRSAIKVIKYTDNCEPGFDLYEITNNDDGSVSVEPVVTDGFGDRYNHGLRIFAKTQDYIVVGTANPFYGTQLWRTKNEESTPVAPTRVIGDANNDGAVTIADATLVQKCSVSLEEVVGLDFLCADVNRDGRVTISDVTMIQKYLSGDYTNIGDTGKPLEIDS